MTITTAQIALLMLDGLNTVFDTTNDIPPIHTRVFKKYNSERAEERDEEVALFPLSKVRAEGGATEFADAGQRYTTTYQWLQLALGFVMTRNAIRDNRYRAKFTPNAEALKRSIRQGQEVYAARVFNQALDTTGVYYGGDGQPLLSVSHPTDVGVFANTPAVQAQLSETSIEAAVTAVGYYPDTAGLLAMEQARQLVIPNDLQFTWARIRGSKARVGTADNDLNALDTLGVIDRDPILWPFLTNKLSWYVLTDAKNGLKHFERDPIETNAWPDPGTDNVMTAATWRGGWGWSNSRCLYGSMP